ncbi:MAG: hypothetical protein J0I06_13235 [Planctomycetes bacterium]|nr:hypothetical protein [Planctomycetota bacterium]
MPICRLFLVILVLLQSGLAVGHAHACTHPGRTVRTQNPHIHACELADLFAATDHDADAVDLSDVPAPAPPAPGAAALDLGPVEIVAVLEVPADHSFPVGLPPSTAGPQRPLYLVLCTLTI